MPTPPLFWLLAALVLSGLGVTWMWLRRRRRENGGMLSGRMPGYSYTAGRNVGLSDVDAAWPDGRWTPARLETLHGGDRSRIVLTLELAGDSSEKVDETPLTDFLAALARDVQSRTQADVVFLRARRLESDGPETDYLYAPDGRGWAGAESVREAIAGSGVTPQLFSV